MRTMQRPSRLFSLRRQALALALCGVPLISHMPFMAVIKSSKELREEIAASRERVSAITQLAETEERDLTDEEQAEVDTIIGKGVVGSAGYSAGKLGLLHAQLERAEKIEENQAALAQLRAAGQREQNANLTPGQHAGAHTAGMGTPTIALPATARRPGKLNAFVASNDMQENYRQAYTAGRFYLATLFNHEPSRQWCADHGINTTIRAAQSGTVDGKGGFLVPTELESTIILLRDSRGVARREAEIDPMASDVKDSPKQVGGPTASWSGQAAAAVESDTTWENVQLVANKLLSLIRYSSEINEDSIIAMADALTRNLAYAHADEEDKAVFLGDGTATFGGFTGVLNAALAGAIYTATARTTYGALLLADFQNMIAMLPEYADENAKWYVSKRLYHAAMAPIIDAAGGNSGGDIAMGTGRREYSFLSYPVVFTQVMRSELTTLTGLKVACFGDLRQGVKLGDRAGFEVMLSEHAYFANDQLAIRGRSRAAIKVHEVGTASTCGALAVLRMG